MLLEAATEKQPIKTATTKYELRNIITRAQETFESIPRKALDENRSRADKISVQLFDLGPYVSVNQPFDQTAP